MPGCKSKGFATTQTLRAHLRKKHEVVADEYLTNTKVFNPKTKRVGLESNIEDQTEKVPCLICPKEKEIVRRRMKEHLVNVHKLGPFEKGSKVTNEI